MLAPNIYYLADFESEVHKKTDFNEFVLWYHKQVTIQLDIETNVVENWDERKLITIQFGAVAFGTQRKQYLFQWSYLSDEQKQVIKELLEDERVEKIAHNAKFEYIVLRFHGIVVENLYDTMLAEKILRGGWENAEYSLADISYKYLRIIMSKEQQTQFGDNVLNDAKLEYACIDVMYLDIIKRKQIEEGAKENLLNVFALEMAALPAFSDITYEGQDLNQEKWRENIRLAEPLVEEAYKQLNTFLVQEPFYTYARTMNYVSDTDRIVINFSAPQQRSELLKLLFPKINGGTMPIIKKFIRDNGPELTLQDIELLTLYQAKDYSAMEKRLIAEHKEYLVSKGYLIPAGEITINWGSPVQVLGVLQQKFPRIKSTGEEVLKELNHGICKQLLKYRESLKLINDLGEEFIRKYVNNDGKVRTNFNQIVSTGRVSSSRPNMQNIIVKEFVGTRYRNAFTPPEGWVYVSGDYVSQELVEIAYISKEPAWLEAIAKGQDLHSVSAEVVLGSKWKDAMADGCDFYKMVIATDGTLEMAKAKCNCPKHKVMRGDIKSVNFLLAYGGTEYKLSGELGITVSEAKALIQLYFSKLPCIRKMFEFLGNFTLTNGYIMTLAPFFRKRWFPYWYENRTYIEAHLSGIMYNKTLGEIQKAGFNHPIQGTAADITKTAMVLVREHLRENKLSNDIKLVCQVHDQIDTICKMEIANDWRTQLDTLMCNAGKVVIPTGILKAEVNISPFWTK